MRGRSGDITKLSTDPAQIRRRIRRADGKISADVDMYLKAKYDKPIEEWDLEELARGRCRDQNGQFRGQAPKWITPVVQKEARRRLLDHAFGTMAAHADLAITTIANLIKSDEVDDKGKPLVDARTRLQACIFILEHIMGKPKALVEVNAAEDHVRSALVPAIILRDGKPKHSPVILEGQYEETDEEGDDEGDE